MYTLPSSLKAAVDALPHDGIAFYLFGAIFIAAFLVVFAIAIVLLLRSSPILDEMDAPLMYHHNQADTPISQQDEQPVMDAEPVAPPIRSISANTTAQQPLIDATITHEAHRANNALDMVLASLNMDKIDTGTFTFRSIEACVNEAVDHYAFAPGEREKVTTAELLDFEFYGSETLLAMVLFNLIKNALYAIKSAGKGDIKISTILAPTFNSLCFTDTGTGVSCDALPKVFDPFFTTKKNGDSGIGLAFCHRVMARFGGCIRCESVSGQFTTFTLEFPMLTNKSDDQKARGDMASQTRVNRCLASPALA